MASPLCTSLTLQAPSCKRLSTAAARAPRAGSTTPFATRNGLCFKRTLAMTKYAHLYQVHDVWADIRPRRRAASPAAGACQLLPHGTHQQHRWSNFSLAGSSARPPRAWHRPLQRSESRESFSKTLAATRYRNNHYTSTGETSVPPRRFAFWRAASMSAATTPARKAAGTASRMAQSPSSRHSTFRSKSPHCSSWARCSWATAQHCTSTTSACCVTDFYIETINF